MAEEEKRMIIFKVRGYESEDREINHYILRIPKNSTGVNEKAYGDLEKLAEAIVSRGGSYNFEKPKDFSDMSVDDDSALFVEELDETEEKTLKDKILELSIKKIEAEYG